MQHTKEKFQLEAGRFRNVTIASHKFKNIHVYERGGKVLQSLFKEYQDSRPEGEGYAGFGICMTLLS